jgi:DNA-binding MarR family transcriptional regulator
MPRTRSGVPGTGAREGNASKRDCRLDLFRFVPFRLNRLAAEVSRAVGEYQERYGLDIPEWRVLATLGFRNDACSAQYIAHCTRTHKSTISRAVTALMKRQLVERVENEDDRREFRLRLTRKGKALYEELIPRLLRREQEILSRGLCRQQERKDFALMLGKIEKPRSGADEQRSGRHHARCGSIEGCRRACGFLVSTHSSQARSSRLCLMSVM